ncbi:HNH endonuclease [Clostridium saccharoperbutylacetonicum]|uniref:HNH endonuclease n=1 Tax=Clostridium saccharoperbutylacetonicum TaxID=36745 RepID=UPI000983BB57|nr:hypothetical protein [Clostridium saccharoperbutylacetonicum]AQR96142.1 hypothetical protein CLSAP_34610 [Clostridium saccharoperbutylacetonicum]NSB32012.1 hypothetical protein [Clostridium saccharoperbutylacetonicum]
MFKIKLSNEMKESHKHYFDKYIVSKLQNNKLEFANLDVIEFNKKGNKLYSKDYIQNNHNDFIQYCIDNTDRISIGNFQELRNVDSEIRALFPVVIKLIEEKFEFSNDNIQYSGKKYWEVLLELFGYDDFGECSLYTVLRDSAKNYNSIDKTNTYEKRERVQDKIIDTAKKIFPEIENEIDKNLKKINSTGNKVIMSMKEFKNEFEAIEKKFSLALTLDNYKKCTLCNIWNSYIFVFASDIRICPYCNRQYITPILTSNGKMRGTLDHFVAKNEYPYFSMSLYNLVPTCYSCNSSFKGDTEFSFNDINPYEESMDDYIKFHANMRIKKPIHISIKKKTINKKAEIEKYLDTFKLESQYSYHINQVEELIFKRLVYTEEYIKDLSIKYKIPQQIVKEQLIGYTENKLKINDEPLSKFRRDIVEQLNFFDDTDKHLINTLEKILGKENSL